MTDTIDRALWLPPTCGSGTFGEEGEASRFADRESEILRHRGHLDRVEVAQRL